MSRGPDGQGLQVLPPRVHPEPDPQDQNTARGDQSLPRPGRGHLIQTVIASTLTK